MENTITIFIQAVHIRKEANPCQTTLFSCNLSNECRVWSSLSLSSLSPSQSQNEEKCCEADLAVLEKDTERWREK